VKIPLVAAALFLLVAHDALPEPGHDFAGRKTLKVAASPIDGPILLGPGVTGANAIWFGLGL
jgi:hypothetical protein